MDDATGGYVTDVDYTWGYAPELSPAVLNWVAARRGYAPRPTDQPFTYLELGCGHGVSLNVHAAAFPMGQFVGVDFMASHVENGQAMADQGGLSNVVLHRVGFQDLLAQHPDLPRFDFIALHGVFSWIKPAFQDAIVDILEALLAPGGIAYLSYNALPGQTLVEPVRTLMRASTQEMSGGTRARAEAGLAFVEKMLAVNPRAFGHGDRIPRLVKRLAAKRDTGRIGYVVHEYFHEHWTSFYVTDVCARLARADLCYAGSATLVRNRPEFNLRPDQLALLVPILDPIQRLLVQDYLLDEQFRRDVFVRDGVVRDGVVEAEPGAPSDGTGLFSLRLGTLLDAAEVGAELVLPAGRITFLRGAAEARVVEMLCTGHCTVLEILQDPSLQDVPPRRILEMLDLLLAARRALPVATEMPATSGPTWPRDAAWEIPNPWNRSIIQQRIGGGRMRTIAAPAAGTGLPLPMLHACILDGLAAAGTQGAVDHAVQELQRHRRVLVVDGERVSSAPEQTQTLGETLDGFHAGTLERYVRLGVIRQRTGPAEVSAPS